MLVYRDPIETPSTFRKYLDHPIDSAFLTIGGLGIDTPSAGMPVSNHVIRAWI